MAEMTVAEAIEFHTKTVGVEQRLIIHALAHPKNHLLGGENTLELYVEKHRKVLEASELAIAALRLQIEENHG